MSKGEKVVQQDGKLEELEQGGGGLPKIDVLASSSRVSILGTGKLNSVCQTLISMDRSIKSDKEPVINWWGALKYYNIHADTILSLKKNLQL